MVKNIAKTPKPNYFTFGRKLSLYLRKRVALCGAVFRNKRDHCTAGSHTHKVMNRVRDHVQPSEVFNRLLYTCVNLVHFLPL